MESWKILVKFTFLFNLQYFFCFDQSWSTIHKQLKQAASQGMENAVEKKCPTRGGKMMKLVSLKSRLAGLFGWKWLQVLRSTSNMGNWWPGLGKKCRRGFLNAFYRVSGYRKFTNQRTRKESLEIQLQWSLISQFNWVYLGWIGRSEKVRDGHKHDFWHKKQGFYTRWTSGRNKNKLAYKFDFVTLSRRKHAIESDSSLEKGTIEC